MKRKMRPAADTDAGLVDPVLQFMRLMWKVDHELQSVSKHMEATIGLTGPQRLALLFIGQRPGMAAKELASLLHLDPGTVTGIVRRLEAAGLIEREWDARDSRRMRLTLTRDGRSANRRRSGTIESAVRRVWNQISEADRDAASSVMSRLASTLRQTVRVSRPAPRLHRSRSATPLT